MAKQHKFYAVVIPGLESLAAKELESLSAHDIEIEHGGIQFSGTMQLLYRVNLRSRIITRVLLRLRTFRTMTLEGLRYDLQKVAWHLFFDEKTKLDVEVHTSRSRLNHSDEIAEFTKDTIHKLLPKMGEVSLQQCKQTLHIKLDNNRGVLSLDTSGERLDRRGYRLESGKAPMRETLAAACIAWSEWTPEQTLLVPMCGSGTIAIEAALIGLAQAPNLEHDFSFLHFPSHHEKDYLKVFERCAGMEKEISLTIQASDFNEGAIDICRANASRAGVESMLEIGKSDVHQLTKPECEHGGVVILNPPYAYRIGEEEKVISLWADIGHILKQQFTEDSLWKTIILCPDIQYEKALKLPIKKRLLVKHGGLDIAILEV